MNSASGTTAFYYYSFISILAATICLALVGFLSWPLLAEIPLAICIFVQILALSKGLYKYWDQYYGEDILTEILTITKSDLLRLEAQEEEANV